MNCQHAGRCSGCSWISLPLTEQLKKKKEAFTALCAETGLPVPDFSFFSVGEVGFRERLEFIIEEGRMGLLETGTRTVLDLNECPITSPPLEAFFRSFKKRLPPIRRGSVRLRVSPSGEKGAWLDFANTDVRDLLKEENWLSHLLEEAIVEIGQKRKRLIREPALKLSDPKFTVWTETYAGDVNLPVYSSIASFTQVGRKANRLLTDALKSFFPNNFPQNWVEYGSGSGTFTLPLLKWGALVKTVETDKLAEEALLFSTQELGLPPPVKDLERVDVILVDPPRSGFPQLIKDLKNQMLPPFFVYVTCYKESYVKDALELLNLGYKPQKTIGVDQFPHTPHCEFLTLFEKC